MIARGIFGRPSASRASARAHDVLIGALGHFISQSSRHVPVPSTFIFQSSIFQSSIFQSSRLKLAHPRDIIARSRNGKKSKTFERCRRPMSTFIEAQTTNNHQSSRRSKIFNHCSGHVSGRAKSRGLAKSRGSVRRRFASTFRGGSSLRPGQPVVPLVGHNVIFLLTPFSFLSMENTAGT